MITIKTKISIKDKELIQVQYISEHFIVTEINDKKLLFVPGSVLFSVNTENKTLTEIDITSQVEQIKKVKILLGEMKEEEIDDKKNIAGFDSKRIKVFNIADSAIKLSMDAYIATIPGINKTIYPEFVRFEQSKQFFHFDLQQNEIIVSMKLEIYAQGNLMQNQSMEIISINDELENNKEYFEYLLYPRSA